MHTEKILWLGSSQTGKTTLLKKLCEDKVAFEWYIPTIGSDLIEFDVSPGLSIHHRDTAGETRFVDPRLPIYKTQTHQICLVYRPDSEQSFNDLSDYLSTISDSTAHLVLIKNCSDDKEVRISDATAKAFAKQHNLAFFEVSTKTGFGIDALKEHLYIHAYMNAYDVCKMDNQVFKAFGNLLKSINSPEIKLIYFVIFDSLAVAMAHQDKKTYFSEIKNSLDKKFTRLYQLDREDFAAVYLLFDKIWTECGLADASFDTIKPCSARYSAQRLAQNMKCFISDQNASQINQAIVQIVKHLNKSMLATDPHNYFETHQGEIQSHLSTLQTESSSIYNSVCNMLATFFSGCLSFFYEPAWLAERLRANQAERGNPHMFFAFGLKQKAQRDIVFFQTAISAAHDSMSAPMVF